MANDNGSNSRKRKAGAPKETGGKKRKTETKISKQVASKKDKGKNGAKVGKQKNKAQTTANRKGSTSASASKQKNGATAQTNVSKGNIQATVSKQKNGVIKKPPVKAARPEKKTKDTKKMPAKAGEPAKKVELYVVVTPGVSHETVIKKPPAKSARPEKKTEDTKKMPAKAAEPAKKVEFVLKEGVPKDDELEGLSMDISDKWMNLGRRLNIEVAKLQAIVKDFDSVHERGFQMLKHWKQKQGSGANYKSLSDALKHRLMERKDLAEKYCFKRQYSKV